MQREQGDSPDAEIRAFLEAGDVDRAATEAIRRYGAEILGFLLALHHGDEDGASDVFSTFCEQIWRGLSKFEWACSLRTWAYAVARNASHHHRRAERRWEQRKAPLSGCVSEMAALVRTQTLTFLRTERQREIVRLRQALSEQDQALLILRVDRDLPWLDLARVFLGESSVGEAGLDGVEARPSAAALQREAARLRKRFQLIKRQLLQLGRERGLIPEREA